ncbi:MAG: hypothetical protein IJ373_06810 [Clostridia bacterium]|nr:hypothetical protein [Clostridia bacterium]
MAIKSQKIVSDFETTTDKNDVRVWAVCSVDIDDGETVYIGNSIERFFDWLQDKNTVCYFHNLKFDGEFLLHYLLTHGYKHSDKPTENCFETLITDTGIFYSITVYFKRENKKWRKVVFYDSLKKLPFKVATIAKAFDLPMAKGSIDYDAPRPIGHELTEEEREYIQDDCRIVAAALKTQIGEGLTRMTNASDALNSFKAIIGKEKFERLFPVFPIELDADIRRAYKGGFVYLNPKYRGYRGLKGITLDVNSLYPWAMYSCLLPFGYPVYFEGEPEPDDRYPLFIVRIQCEFELKPDHIPTIQLKNNRAFIETEYLTSSNGEIVQMTLTNVDLRLFLDNYNVWNLEYIAGWKFKGKVGIFKDYIDHWMHIKETTTGAKRQLAKLMLNSLYGKFATNPKSRKKTPYLDEDGIVRYHVTDVEERDPVYTAMGAFITAYAREKTIRSAQTVYDRFIYADTDSLHLIGHEVPENLEVHPTRLGAWKNEGCFDDSIFVRAKTYIEVVDGKVKVTCAGMPDNVKEQVTLDNFHSGSTFGGKLMPRRHKGGIVLESTTFTIK